MFEVYKVEVYKCRCYECKQVERSGDGIAFCFHEVKKFSVELSIYSRIRHVVLPLRNSILDAPWLPDWHQSTCFCGLFRFYPVDYSEHCTHTQYCWIRNDFFTWVSFIFDCCSKIHQEGSGWVFCCFHSGAMSSVEKAAVVLSKAQVPGTCSKAMHVSKKRGLSWVAWSWMACHQLDFSEVWPVWPESWKSGKHWWAFVSYCISAAYYSSVSGRLFLFEIGNHGAKTWERMEFWLISDGLHRVHVDRNPPVAPPNQANSQ